MLISIFYFKNTKFLISQPNDIIRDVARKGYSTIKTLSQRNSEESILILNELTETIIE